MASRLYFSNVNPPLTTTNKGGWSSTTSSVSKGLTSAGLGSNTTIAISESSNTANYKPKWGQWVSPPLSRDYSFSGSDTFNISVGTLESSTSADQTLCLYIWVTAGDTDTSRGALYALTAGGTELPTSAASRYISGVALSSVSASAGDRIVVEIGYNAADTSTSSYTGTMNYGSSAAAQLNAADGDTSVTSRYGWIEFSPESLFGKVNYAKANINRSRYWVGDGGTWTDTSHWSYSSGGTTGAPVPTQYTNVYFDGNSFTTTGQTVTVPAGQSCNNMDWTGSGGDAPTVTFQDTFNIYGNLTLASGVIWTSSGIYFKFVTTEAKTCVITTNGVTIKDNVEVNTPSGTVQLADTFTMRQDSFTWLMMRSGTFDTNNQTVNFNKFGDTSGASRTFTPGSSTINLTGGLQFDSGDSSLTVTANTSTINMNSGGWDSGTFYGNGKTFNNVNFNVSTTVTGANTFNAITIAAGKTLTLPASTTTTIQSLTSNGTGVSNAYLYSSSVGTQATISDTAGTNSVSYLQIRDSKAQGGASFITDTTCTDLGNNSGWQFTRTKVNYAKGNVASKTAINYVKANIVGTYYNGFRTHLLVDNYPTTKTIGNWGIGSGDSLSRGETFTGNGGILDKVEFYVQKNTGASGNTYAKIYNMTGTYGSSGKPTGSAIATSDAVDASTYGTTLGIKTFTFSGANRIQLTAGTNYCVALEYTGTPTIGIAENNTTYDHSGNGFYTLNLTDWNAYSTADFIFYVYQQMPTASTKANLGGRQVNYSRGYIYAAWTKVNYVKARISLIVTSSSYSKASLGNKIYTRGSQSPLPSGDNNQSTSFTASEIIDVDSDNAVRISSYGTLPLHIFKVKNTNNTDTPGAAWNGQSDLAPSSSTVYLQIYNQISTTWETLDSDNETGANTDFSLSGTATGTISEYYATGNWVSFRVYQTT